ncbi:MAG: methyltransferase domain-containing protein [Gaiellaceae bacterium]
MEPTEHNRRAWDEVHRRRAETMRERLGIPEPVRERLPDLKGKHVLHLQCATGEDSAELVELGALVTGVDVSAEALALAHERAPTAAFVQADVQDLPLQLRRARFDLVYTGGGVLAWLHDLDAWAHGIATALRPGSELLLYDNHPVAACLQPIGLRWLEDYFDESPIVETEWSHFDLPGEPAEEKRVERFWRLGQIVTAIAGAGLVIRSLEEFPEFDAWRRLGHRVPGDFVLTADKPA